MSAIAIKYDKNIVKSWEEIQWDLDYLDVEDGLIVAALAALAAVALETGALETGALTVMMDSEVVVAAAEDVVTGAAKKL